jgi:prepilin-type N-terminal cleavage/methylation domain-containing protein
MKARMGRTSGFTLVEIMIVVGIVGMLAAIAIPNFIRARTRSQANACINNLRQIEAAKQTWAMENRRASNAMPQQSDLDTYMGRSGSANGVICPAGGAGATFTSSYTINSVANKATCNIVPSGPEAHALSDSGN